ncbi:hypothetical protein FHX74_001936 [Friedmanniella endophytica]|uniref:Cell division protein FtsL n=1 Tax=Microlunatus kandeliicorticis TaxID=1759536 RepID=A0A7W3IS95_9ACTN|nr:hypothetical protein [Microlunatus kandeliicorticis]MBA8794317.1 hypothetical protein [Microlunatus kandeliicorticis]
MSAVWEAETPDWSDEVADEQPRRRLRAVPRRRQRMARTPFVLVLIVIFGLGMAGLLMLNTTLQNQAVQAQKLNNQATVLTYEQASLSRQLQQVEAPQELARRASALGMRADPYPAFIRTSDGKIIGYPDVVQGNEEPTQIVKTPEQLQAEAKAAAAKAAAAQAAKEAAAKQAAAEAAAQAKAQQAKAKQSSQKNGKSTNQKGQNASTAQNGRN